MTSTTDNFISGEYSCISQRSEHFEGLDAFQEKILESLDPSKNFEQNLVSIGILI